MTTRKESSNLYREYLKAAAARIHQTYRRPLDISRLAQDLGISIKLQSENVAKPLLVQSKDGWVVKLASEAGSVDRLPPSSRFSLMHELGHFLLVNRFNVVPSGTSEYWLHEQLCDFFAAHALVPDEILTSLSTPDLEKLYLILPRVSKSEGIPYRVLAKRLCEFRSEIALFVLRRQKSRRASTDYFEVFMSGLQQNQEMNRRVPVNSELGTKLQAIGKSKRGVWLNASCFSANTLPSCKTGRAGYAALRNETDIALLVLR